MVLDDVHGAHGQARAIHHATDGAVELDEIEIEFGGFDFFWGFFVQVTERQNVRVAEKGVVIKAHLGVQRDDIASLGDDQGIHFDHGAVFFNEKPVEVLQKGDALLERIAFELQRKSDFPGLEG